MKRKNTLRLTYAAICLALAFVLPFLTAQIPKIGNALSPMHIPVFLCGFLCGWPYGLTVGFLAPLLRSIVVGMPPIFPKAISMAFELATYGSLSGLLYRALPKKPVCTYLTLIVSMVAGRLVWGAARYLFAGISGGTFPFSAFLAGAVTDAIPGILLHILLVPVIVLTLQKAKLIPE